MDTQRKMQPRARPAPKDGDTPPAKPSATHVIADVGLLRVTVEMGGRTYQEDLRDQALIETDFDGINAALSEHAARFAWWAMLAARAAAKARRARRLYERVKAEAYARLERDLERLGKKTTVVAIESAMRSDEKVIAAQQVADDAEDQSETLVVARQTMQARKDALLELARNFRSASDQGLEVRGSGEGQTMRPTNAAAGAAAAMAKRVGALYDDDNE